MRKSLALFLALVGGLIFAWALTLIGAEILRSLTGPWFAGTDWPAWFPTTPIVLVTLALWALIARTIWRALSRRRDRRA